MLLALGLPAPLALGTNQLGADFGSGSTTWTYARRGEVSMQACGPGIIATIAGALGGSSPVGRLDSGFLARAIPWLLTLLVIHTISHPKLGESSRRRRISPLRSYALCWLALGFYDSLFWPGVGSFWTIAFVGLLGLDFLWVPAQAQVMNFAGNAAALALFSAVGPVLVVPGLVIGAWQLMGERVGAHLAPGRGPGLSVRFS